MIEGHGVLRSMTDDGGFRVITVRADEMAREAALAQRQVGDHGLLLAELMVGAVLFRETMAPLLRVQCVLDGPGGDRVVLDSFPDGDTRGLVVLSGPVQLGPEWRLRMSRSLPRKPPQEGVIAVPAAGGLSAALTAYMQESEQVVSVVQVAAVGSGADLRAAGYIVQLLPELSSATLAIMTARLESMPSLDGFLERDLDIVGLTDAVLAGMPYTRLEQRPIRFACRCSRERAAAALAHAARGEVELACKEGRPLETTCEFCHTAYRFEVAEQLSWLATGTREQ